MLQERAATPQTTMRSFVEIPPPPAHRDHPINRFAQWFTWAPASREHLSRWAAATQSLPDPAIVDLRPGEKYARTYSCRSLTPSQPLAEWVAQVATDLYTLPLPSGVLFFTELLGTVLDRRAFRFLIAAVRDAIAKMAGSEESSLYAPLGRTGPAAGRFPVHADLYAPEMLLNIFDDTSANADALLLRVREFERVLPIVSSMPDAVRLELLRCLRVPAFTDRFDHFYDLLYDPQNPWAAELASALEARQLRIRLSRGEGYLIHDRSWLHGRDAPSGEISINRVHRLVFTRAAMATFPVA